MTMKPDVSGGRNLKRIVLEALRVARLSDAVREIVSLPERQVINPLISFLLNKDPIVRWRSVIVIGDVLSNLALKDMEGARVIMRRFMWSLNDESGGIGWGAPEAMCVCIGKSDKIADEFHHMVVSYLEPEGNYLEYEPLQRGLLWGIAYLAQTRPNSVLEAKPYIGAYLDSKDSHVRGLATIVVKRLGLAECLKKLQELVPDKNEFFTYEDDCIKMFTVGEKASEAIKFLDQN